MQAENSLSFWEALRQDIFTHVMIYMKAGNLFKGVVLGIFRQSFFSSEEIRCNNWLKNMKL